MSDNEERGLHKAGYGTVELHLTTGHGDLIRDGAEYEQITAFLRGLYGLDMELSLYATQHGGGASYAIHEMPLGDMTLVAKIIFVFKYMMDQATADALVAQIAASACEEDGIQSLRRFLQA